MIMMKIGVAGTIRGVIYSVLLAAICGLSTSDHEDKKDVCSTIKIIDEFSMKQLDNCTIVKGNLEITLMKFQHRSYPKLREVTGYMLVYRVFGLKTLSDVFPNLAVIRGENTISNYAFIVYETPDLEDLGLKSLSVIMKGAIRLEKNGHLCYASTIDWSRIAISVNPEENVISDNRDEIECVNKCPENCSKSKKTERQYCWNAEHCQANIGCPDECNYCDSHTKKCCPEVCIGGCHGQTESDCFACKHVLYQKKCKYSCPDDTYLWKDRFCLSKKQCNKIMTSGTWHHKALDFVLPDNTVKRICAQKCPEGYSVKEKKTCVKCQERCKKECVGGIIDNVRTAQQLTNCTIIHGSIIIQIDEGSNIAIELEKSLGAIEEVMHLIKIVRSYPLLTLHFFRNLKVIHGMGHGADSNYGLIVMNNPNLKELFLPRVSKRLKLKRKAQFRYNRNLCYYKIEKFLSEVGLSNSTTIEDSSPHTNGNDNPCNMTIFNLELQLVTEDNVLLKWEKVQLPDPSVLFSYFIYYREVNSKDVEIYQGIDACSNSVWKKFEKKANHSIGGDSVLENMHNLTPFTQYAAYVQPFIVGSAPKVAVSNIVYFTTKASNPTRPTNLRISAKRRGELHITWDKPERPNGNVTHYLIYWELQKLNHVTFHQRNYCEYPLSMNKYHVSNDGFQEEWKEEETNNKTIIYKSGCCSCSKNDRARSELELKIHPTQMEFENRIRKLVFMKSRNSAKLRAIVESELGRKRKKKKPKKSQSLSIADLMNPFGSAKPKTRQRADPLEIDDILKALQSSSMYNGPSKPVSDDEEDVEMPPPPMHAVVYDKEIIITNLGDYESYSIKIVACQETTPNKQYLCGDDSESALDIGRTLAWSEADNINPSSIQEIRNNTNNVFITWEPPTKPNSVIVTYEIEYAKVGYDDMFIPVTKCVTHNSFTTSRGFLLEQLTPGNYTYRIRVTTLAGNGTWSPEFHFYILDDSELVDVSVILLVSVIVIIAVFIFMGILIRFRCHNDEMTTVSFNPSYMPSFGVYIPDEWEIDRNKIEFKRELGNGTFGKVWEGVIEGYQDGLKQRIKVAIKIINQEASWYDKKNFLEEATTMKAFHCHHVVKLIGVVSRGHPVLVIMELMAKRDLKKFLRSLRPTDQNSTDDQDPPSINTIMQILGEIADGMAYLADKKFVHRDLAARNCMVAEDNTVKIGDFGMTRDIYETDYYRKGGRGFLPVRWMPPESLRDGIFTTKSDVWSYGVVLWELATLAAQPYQGLSNEEVVKYVCDGNLMKAPENCPENMYNLMLQCWSYKDKERPTFKEIIQMLIPYLDPKFENVSYFFSDENKSFEFDDTDEE